MGGRATWWRGHVCPEWVCVRGGSSGTVIYRLGSCDWGFGRACLCLGLAVCMGCLSVAGAVIYVNQS